MTRTKIDTGSVGDQRFLYRLEERGRSRAKSYLLEALGPLAQPHQRAMGERGPGSHLNLPAYSQVEVMLNSSPKGALICCCYGEIPAVFPPGTD